MIVPIWNGLSQEFINCAKTHLSAVKCGYWHVKQFFQLTSLVCDTVEIILLVYTWVPIVFLRCWMIFSNNARKWHSILYRWLYHLVQKYMLSKNVTKDSVIPVNRQQFKIVLASQDLYLWVPSLVHGLFVFVVCCIIACFLSCSWLVHFVCFVFLVALVGLVVIDSAVVIAQKDLSPVVCHGTWDSALLLALHVLTLYVWIVMLCWSGFVSK